MAFSATLEKTDSIATITLAGELDGKTASEFKAKVEEAAASNPKRLVLLMKDLEFMASAGLRILIFAKQKMGSEIDIYVVEPQEMVLDTIEKTGFHHSVIVLNTYDADKIENI